MKHLFLFLTFLLSNLLSLHAQTPSCEVKCFSGNCQNSFGKYQYSNCVVYEGFFKDSKPNGKGKYLYTTGDVYDGEFIMGKREGFGEFKWTDGTRYEGDWKADVMDGKGTIWYANGEKYVGECYNSNREGKGIHYNANGTVFHDGYWKNNDKAPTSTSVTGGTQNSNSQISGGNTTNTTPPADEDDYSWLDAWLDSYDETTDESATKTEETKSKTITGETTQGTSSGNFCTDYKTIAATAGEYFTSIQGSIRSQTGDMFKTTIYNTTKSITGSKDCYVQYILGTSYYAIFGEYDTYSAAETKFNELQGKIKSCMTDKLLENGKTTEYILKDLSIIKKYPDGFDLFGDQLDIYKSVETGKYEVRLYISTNTWNNRVYTITSPGGSGDATFDTNLKKIMESSRNTFAAVLGEKHETKNLFGTYVHYDINATLPGIFDLSYTEGGFALTKEITGVRYDGSSEADAKRIYNELAEKIKKSLGYNYVYITTEDDKGEWKNFKLASKSEMKADDTPVVTVKYDYDSYDKKYSVEISFGYKAFGGIL
jgi:hypothetical protein